MKRLFATICAIIYLAIPCTPLIAMAAPPPVDQTAANTKAALCQGTGGSIANGTVDNAACGTNIDKHLTDHIGDITSTLLIIAGAVAVIIIIIAGLRYIISQGDSAAVKGAKDTLLYAIIGLVVIILAYAIVHFVNTQLS